MKKSIKLEAPDGGWGILVCIGMTIPLICIYGSLPSFGLVFGDFLISIGAETTALAFIISSFFMTLSLAGLFVNILYKKFSLRIVGLVGGILYFIGSVMQVYVKTTVDLTVAYSLVQGIAAGLIIPTAITKFNSYFVKRRVMMMAFSQTLTGIGGMLYPIVVQKLNEFYGFRGCLLVIAAINSHVILGMLVMQPVEWHMKRVEVSDDEIEKDRSQPLLDAEECRSQKPLNPNENISKIMRNYASLDIQEGSTVLSTSSSVPVKRSCWQLIIDFLDLSLLKDPIYLNIALGISFALYSELTFYTLKPMYLFELNYTKMETANIIAIGAATELISRMFMTLCFVFIKVPSRYVFLAGASFVFITRFALLKVVDFVNMVIVTVVTVIMGVFVTCMQITMSLIIAEHLPMERLASGYGLFMFLQGSITFLVGPIVGYIRDRTEDYVITLHCTNFFMALCVFPWLLEIVYLKYRKQKK